MLSVSYDLTVYCLYIRYLGYVFQHFANILFRHNCVTNKYKYMLLFVYPGNSSMALPKQSFCFRYNRRTRRDDIGYNVMTSSVSSYLCTVDVTPL